MQDRITEEFEKRKGGLLVFAVLLGFGFFINRGVELKGLYMDDLYLWSCYGEQSFREFVFPVGGSRFRFLFYLEAWLELLLIGNHVTWMVPFNIVLNVCIACTIYRIAVSVSDGRKFISLFLGAAYLLSRLSYYQISQFYGLMESMALWAAIGLLYCLYRYMNGQGAGAYLQAVLLYFAVSFTHERYMGLLPLFPLALLLRGRTRTDKPQPGRARTDGDRIDGRRSEREYREMTEAGLRTTGRSRGKAARMRKGPERKNAGYAYAPQPGLSKGLLLLITGLTFAVIQGIRFVMIGTLVPAGTGGTEVSDTFDIGEAVSHALSQVLYVFGVNNGPEHLCAKTFADTPFGLRLCILASIAVLAVCVLLFFIDMVRHPGHIGTHAKNILLFLAFIALCIGSSSVTIRVELRWVYASYAAALLFLAYMSKRLGRAGVLVILYTALLFPAESYYRDQWDLLYYMPNQLRCNSLAEQTIEKYGEDIFGKQVYIIGNSYEFSDFTARTFLKVYAGGDESKNTAIQFIESDFDFKEIPDNAVILAEDKKHNAYEDVTEFLRRQRMNRVYGCYEDGWIDEESRMVFMNGDSDKLMLDFYYPGELTGNETCRIRVNGEELPALVFTEQTMSYEIATAPYQMISLELSANFHVENAQEKRGDTELAMVVTMREDGQR